MCAAAEGHESIVQLLMDNGADVDAQSYDNANAVRAATAYGHAGVVRLLLGAVAAGVGKLVIVRELLRRGAIPPKGFQDLIETVHDPYWKIPDSTGIKRLLLARIVSRGFFQKPVERLRLSHRILKCLKSANLSNLGQVFDTSDDELLAIRNFNDKSLKELKNCLETLMYQDDEMPPDDD